MLRIFIRRRVTFKISCNCSDLIYLYTKNQLFSTFIEETKSRLEPNTFQPRILKYFEDSSQRVLDKIPIEFTITPQHYNADIIRKLDNNELNSLIYQLLGQKLNNNHLKYYIQWLDKECCSRLPYLKSYEIFSYLNIFMHLLPNVIVSLKFYKKSIDTIYFQLDRCTQLELMQLCFYIGLQKKSKESKRMLKHCLLIINNKFLNNLNVNDMAVLCNSCYKTSTKIQYKNILEKLLNILNNNIVILSDPTIFVEYVKSLRHNQYQNEEILSTISHAILFNKTYRYYSFTACSHILALYADVLFYDDNLFKMLTKICLSHLKSSELPKSKKEHFSRQLRIKDVTRFLWSLSYISYDKLNANVFRDHIEPLLENHMKLNHFEKDIENVIDTLLWMCLLNYTPSDQVLSTALTRNTILLIYGKRKQDYIKRLNLLLTCINWERPELFQKLQINQTPSPNPNTDALLKRRSVFKILYNSLCTVAPFFDIDKIEYTFPIPHLHIMGLTGYTKENKATLYVEFVDETVLIQNKSETSNGFMNLKLRLLKQLGKTVLVVFEHEIIDKDQPKLNTYLKNKLKKIYAP